MAALSAAGAKPPAICLYFGPVARHLRPETDKSALFLTMARHTDCPGNALVCCIVYVAMTGLVAALL